jgi:arsenate reductase
LVLLGLFVARVRKMSKQTILFLCTHNAARSQMAEGFVNARFGDRYVARSAGSEPTGVHPCAIEVMAELGIDISRQHAKSLSEFGNAPFDYVVTMCADAAANCPIFPGGANYLHHPFNDPEAGVGSGLEHCASFRNVRDRIGVWIEATFSDNP